MSDVILILFYIICSYRPRFRKLQRHRIEKKQKRVRVSTHGQYAIPNRAFRLIPSTLRRFVSSNPSIYQRVIVIIVMIKRM